MVIGSTLDHDAMIAHLFTDQLGETISLTGKDGQTGSAASDRAGSENAASAVTAPAGRRVTGRELEVLRLVALGWDTPSIARELSISQHTALNHIRHFRRKLNATTKLDAVVTAIRMGLLEID